MASPSATHLSHRSIIRIGGADRHAFLQGLISNDVMKVTETNATYAALLTPQGKFLHDMFILEHDGAFLADCEAGRAADLLQRLNTYKLRSKVTFDNLADTYDVWALWDGDYRAPLAFADPRLPELGMRMFTAKYGMPLNAEPAAFADYDAQRIALGVGDGSRDMEVEKATLAEGNFDFLNGVDWKKGCYVGQELTARMHYRGLAKKRLFPVRIEGDIPPAGAIFADEPGEMRSHSGDGGLALLKIEAVQQAIGQEKPLTYGETRIWPFIPPWMKIDAKPANR